MQSKERPAALGCAAGASSRFFDEQDTNAISQQRAVAARSLRLRCTTMRYASEIGPFRPSPGLPHRMWEFDYGLTRRLVYRRIGQPDPDAPLQCLAAEVVEQISLILPPQHFEAITPSVAHGPSSSI